MKQTLKRIIGTVKSVKGNSLAEFATTTALMATLAATAAPKLSEMSEGAKAEKSRNELDKMVKQAGQFYQDTADIEGRGRFPGQDKYNLPVPAANTQSSAAHETAILADLIGNGSTAATYTSFTVGDGADWVSVFGKANADFPKPAGTTLAADDAAGTCGDCPGIGNYPSLHGVDASGTGIVKSGHDEWKQLFGGEVVGSQYQDGHFVYQVVKGGGTGSSVYPPTLYVADIENATHFNNVLMP
ncbi:MAG: hypothetical protein CBE24_06485 [bacterium TMED264]|nr:MAG: hypothetical protein CBE24_06485 [bacterium TMED264]